MNVQLKAEVCCDSCGHRETVPVRLTVEVDSCPGRADVEIHPELPEGWTFKPWYPSHAHCPKCPDAPVKGRNPIDKLRAQLRAEHRTPWQKAAGKGSTMDEQRLAEIETSHSDRPFSPRSRSERDVLELVDEVRRLREQVRDLSARSLRIEADFQAENTRAVALRDALVDLLERSRQPGCPVPDCAVCLEWSAAVSAANRALAPQNPEPTATPAPESSLPVVYAQTLAGGVWHVAKQTYPAHADTACGAHIRAGRFYAGHARPSFDTVGEYRPNLCPTCCHA